jgi:hypothetical protein
MDIPPFISKYRQPLITNGISFLILAALYLRLVLGKQEGGQSLDDALAFLFSIILLPFLNLALFLIAFFTHRRHLLPVYGLLSIVFFILALGLVKSIGKY